MTAALIFRPRKSDAEEARRRMCRVVISETGTSFCEEDEVSWIEKAIVVFCLRGWDEAWHGDGSIESKLFS